MINAIRREPALILGLVQAVIALVVAFGLDLTGEQTAGILAVTAAVLGLVVRSQVTPTTPSEPDERGDVGLIGLVVVVLLVVVVFAVLR